MSNYTLALTFSIINAFCFAVSALLMISQTYRFTLGSMIWITLHIGVSIFYTVATVVLLSA